MPHSSWNSDTPQRLALRSVQRACAPLGRSQEADGAWRVPPLPRLLENALACLVAEVFVPELRPHVTATRRWVRSAESQRHHEVPRLLETWLRARVDGAVPAPTLDVSHVLFSEPVFSDRRTFFLALAFAVGAPVRGGPSREVLQSQMLERIRARHAARLKRWSGAELAALFLLLADARPTPDTAAALEALREAQSASGSFGEHPWASLVGLAALRRWTPGSAAFTRALDFLVRERTAEGLWCFSHADVWDTALLCRALKGCEDLAPAMFARAGSFLQHAQNEDGGWPYRGGVESDTDTTAMALLALPRTDAMRAALEAGRDYLERMRTPDGLWRTWQSREDPPAEDVVAHAVLALRAAGADPGSWTPAVEWLAARAWREGGCRAHWFDIHAYAAHEVALALEPGHEAARYLARQLLETQNPDGGWSPAPGEESSAAASGMALGLLTHYLPVEHPRLKGALHALADLQEPGGAWTGPLRMYAPRPFAIDYPMQVHALAARGMAAVLQATRAPRPPLAVL
ncbi:prenyltransferase/squalene oxidase repeat-containing protein [Archangium violaceum]|uniref:prenyltransferase/squalene oxidase repeat-containing protein n=1 Tax=Archangium violaceum TaxID=83451 RepID=UPI002B2F7C2B|nr:prenyltransferase/squalene oxidase repeat-containing protein [Archangium gephyra]